MARTSAVGYIAARKQGAAGAVGVLGSPDANTTGYRFFRFLSAPKASAELTNNRYREGGGGRDITLSLKEGLKHGMEFPTFIRPTILGYLLAAGTGSSGAGIGGGGTTSNGLYRPPKLKAASVKTTTLTALNKAGDVTLTVAAGTPNFTGGGGDKIVIGWGPNMEFTTTSAATSTTLTVPALKFPHAKGEPVYEVKGYGTIAAIASSATGLTTFDLTASHGFVTADKLAVTANSSASLLGAELGASEELAGVTIAANVVTVTAMRNGHSVGDWVFEYDDAGSYATTRTHGFEPINSLTATLDYYTLERAVPGATAIIERVQDAKLGEMTLSGEAPGPIRLQAGWHGRFGSVRSAAMAEDYTNQGSTDLPFRMPNGKYVIQFGSSTGLSTKLRQFEWNFSNITADDIFTDNISSDDILDLARESNFSCQFYFESAAEYYELYYGSASPSQGTNPTANQTSGPVLLDFSIDSTKRMSVYIPVMTWEGFPTEVDPEPKPLIVEATGVPLKTGGQPLYSIAVHNADAALY